MKIALMGFGVVGSGVGEIIKSNQDNFLNKISENIEVKYILDLRDFPDSSYNCFTKDFNDILNDNEVTAVVEAMGGINPAYEFTKKLLLSGKHVVTSNKELVAKHGTELLDIARKNNVNYMFEASVGGGIPIIRPICSSLTAGEITEVYGILNGTTNYILTKMIKDDVDFSEALKGAQKKGYAESDPTADIEGIDSCRKIAILGSLAFVKSIDCEKIPTEGIANITLTDAEYAEKLNCSIKLIASCQKVQNGIYARVCPMLVPEENLISSISGVFNGIVVKSKELGEIMFYGRGAGKLPTASAVVSDLIDIAKHKDKNIMIRWQSGSDDYLLPPQSQKYSYYIRVKGADIKDFSDTETAVLKKDGLKDEFAFITPLLDENELNEYLNTERFSGCKILGKIRHI